MSNIENKPRRTSWILAVLLLITGVLSAFLLAGGIDTVKAGEEYELWPSVHYVYGPLHDLSPAR